MFLGERLVTRQGTDDLVGELPGQPMTATEDPGFGGRKQWASNLGL